MAKPISQRAQEQVVEPEDVVEERGRKPDFLIKVRQAPQRGGDGKLYKSNNFTTIGAAWKQQSKDGTEFLGCKCNVPGMMMPDSFVLYPPFQEGEK